MKLAKKILGPLLLSGLTAVLLAQEHTQQNEKNPLAGNPAAVTAGQRLYE
jgi:hypothetical protein